ncbi:unnamed protein product [Nesidiocoris tenuis]|uniref:Uncharacterized protein n=1 Tax=Nesidiocoris tenuis TaxID=355587 RepID=A0A6H5H761_9HEMI|nr:unnamed protein product [Nesidiocoris tenuis]
MENFLDIIEHKTLKDSARLEKLDKSCTTEMDEDLTAQINDSIFSKQFEGRKAISVLTLQKCGGHQFNKNPDHEISRNNEDAREGNFQIGSYRPAIGSGINNAQVNFEIEDAYQKADHEAPSSAKCGDSEKMEKISSYRDAISRLQPLLLTLIGKLDESPDTTKFPGHSVSQTFKSLERAPLTVSSSSVPDFHGDQMKVIFSEPKEKSESEITNDDEFDQETDGTLAESAEDKGKSESEPKSNLENPRAPNCTSASEKKNNENSEQSRTKGNSYNIMSSMNDRKKLSSDASMDCETSAIDYEKVRRQISEALGACEDDQVCEGRSKERKLSLKDINERMREILKSKREDGSVSVEESDKKHQQTQDIEPSKGDTLMESHCVQSMRKSDANLSPISEECPQQNTNSFEEKEKNSCQDRFELKTQKPLKRQANGTEIEARQMPIPKAEDELFQQEISECQVLIGELAKDLQKWRKTKRTKLTDTIRLSNIKNSVPTSTKFSFTHSSATVYTPRKIAISRACSSSNMKEDGTWNIDEVKKIIESLHNVEWKAEAEKVLPLCKDAEEREPNSRSSRVPLHEGLVVGERVIVEEEAARYVEGDEHVDRVMLVAGQDEENAEHVQHPSERVQQLKITLFTIDLLEPRGFCTDQQKSDAAMNNNIHAIFDEITEPCSNVFSSIDLDD